jgi:predicted RNA-binding protein with PIN domain
VTKRGVMPGSFDPLTIAHLGIAEAAVQAAGLDRLDLALSNVALGKEHGGHTSLETRVHAIERAAESRPWLGVVVTDARLIFDIAHGYDAVIMGADKWVQVNDAAWYDNDAARDVALAGLPEVWVVPRPGFATDGAAVLDVDHELTLMSSTRVRDGELHLRAPEARRRIIVDGNNVIGTRPDGWWRDRVGATRRLVEALQSFVARTDHQVAVVLDGRPAADLPEGIHDGVLVAYAERAGRDAADDRIVVEVERDKNPASLTVVTSDRGLSERVAALGAHIESAGSFIRELESERP